MIFKLESMCWSTFVYMFVHSVTNTRPNKRSLVGMQLPEKYKAKFDVSSKCPSAFRAKALHCLPWIPEPSTVNNKLKRREGSGSTGRFFD